MNPTTINPANGAVLATYAWHTPHETDALLAAALRGQQTLAAMHIDERVSIIRGLASVLRASVPTMAALITAEMGKPLSQARAEVEKCAFLCDVAADMAARALADDEVEVDGAVARVRHAPIGVVLAIMPWNFPLWQTLRFAVPAIAAGNGMVLKPAPGTIGTGHRTIEMLVEAGVPQGAMACLRVDVDRIGDVIADDRIRGVTFTGSTAAGRVVAEHAGRALKRSVLELGGNDAYIVCADADLDAAVNACVAARCVNNGQSCIAGKRFFVHTSVYAPFVEAMAHRFDAMTVGDPMAEGTDVGPIARRDLRDGLVHQITRALAAGATMATTRAFNDVPSDGFFLRPTVLTGLPDTDPLAYEEIFGPVALVFPFDDEEDAIARANRSPYGLGGAVFARDVARARSIAARMDTGMVAINDMLRSDPRLPFGGVKHSGYGTELGHKGFTEFTVEKVIR